VNKVIPSGSLQAKNFMTYQS